MPMLPMLRMLPAQSPIFLPQTQPASRAKIWCTGKDSNLRTSQGGADLQSAGFNHSPTCAETPTASPSLCAQSRADRGRYEKKEELNARGNALARKHLTWKNFLMECRWKICYAAAPPCPAFQNVSWS